MNNNTLIAGFEDIMTHIKNQEIRIKKLTAAKEEVDKLYYTEYNGKTYEPWELKEENEKLKEQLKIAAHCLGADVEEHEHIQFIESCHLDALQEENEELKKENETLKEENCERMDSHDAVAEELRITKENAAKKIMELNEQLKEKAQ